MNNFISIAPMMDWSDRHYRYFMRLITKHSLLYTEMITSGAIIHGDRDRFLNFNSEEHPIAIQLGGSDPDQLAECSTIATDYGYDEINLNVGCPSDRVQSGRFGACLMAEPDLVAECVHAMKKKTHLPVTVKTRLGIDDRDSYEELCEFITKSKSAGCETFILHARNAWLKGLSPKENRNIPPLKYDVVYKIKKDFPELEIIINGGIKTIKEINDHLGNVDGVMIGREAYHNPYFLSEVDQLFYDDFNVQNNSRKEVVERLIIYMDEQIEKGVHLKHMSRHVLGLFQGEPGAKKWRRHISENAHKPNADTNVIKQAFAEMAVS
ncbi:MAG: tRNA dihydrouridine(20/20a) synthase DusA [Gammaproteobacteria bacterium]